MFFFKNRLVDATRTCQANASLILFFSSSCSSSGTVIFMWLKAEAVYLPKRDLQVDHPCEKSKFLTHHRGSRLLSRRQGKPWAMNRSFSGTSLRIPMILPHNQRHLTQSITPKDTIVFPSIASYTRSVYVCGVGGGGVTKAVVVPISSIQSSGCIHVHVHIAKYEKLISSAWLTSNQSRLWCQTAMCLCSFKYLL